MREPTPTVRRAIEAIADRTPIDWTKFTSAASAGSTGRLVGALRSIERVVEALEPRAQMTSAKAIHRVRGAGRNGFRQLTLAVVAFAPLAFLIAYRCRAGEGTYSAWLAGAPSALSLGLTTIGLVGIGRGLPAWRRLERARTSRRDESQLSLFRANQSLRCATSTAEVLEVLTGEIESTLGVPSAVLVGKGNEFIPFDRSLRAIRNDSAIARVALADTPFVVDPSSRRSLFRWLPAAEQLIVVQGEVSVIVPVRKRTRLEALLALRAARDGQPYSSSDLLYLGALAAAGGLAITRGSTKRLDSSFGALADQPLAGECRTCGVARERPLGSCDCGSQLEPALLPFALNGRFRLTRRLGTGAMGVVYEAEDLELGRTVALKTLPRVSPQLALSLRREARSMARVLHPRITTIFGSEDWQGMPVLVLERLAGTLASRLGCPWRFEQALEVGLAAAEGLAAMHEHGLLHRDVKPSNVGFTFDGGIKLLDFGIAHLLTDALEQPSGTPLYCSPERLDGAPATPADDVWSVSLLVYELLAGTHPWRREGETIVSARPISDIRTFRSDCPPEVALFLAHCVSPRACERPASPGEFRSGVMKVLDGLPSAASRRLLASCSSTVASTSPSPEDIAVNDWEGGVLCA